MPDNAELDTVRVTAGRGVVVVDLLAKPGPPKADTTVAAGELVRCAVSLHVSGLRDGAYTVRHRHLASGVSDLAATAAALGVQGWPTGEQWAALRAADHLVERSCEIVETVAGQVSLELAMVMPSMALVELVPR